MAFTGNAAVVSSHPSLRLLSSSTNQTAFVAAAQAAPDGGGGTYAYIPADTSSGCLFTGSVSGTTLTVSSVSNGTLAAELSVNRGDTGSSIGAILEFGTGGTTGAGGTGTYALSASASIGGPLTFTADNNFSFIVAVDGGRWFEVGYYQQTAAETAASVTPKNYAYVYQPFGYDVRRAGVVPNSAAAGMKNFAALKALFNPTVTGPVGDFIFPNTTGADIYYIGTSSSTCVLPLRDGCRLNLMGCTLQFTGTGTPSDNNSGMLFALHDLAVENGTITVNWATGASTSSGAAICIGARPTGSSYFQVTDSLLTTPLGNVTLRNLRLNITVTGSGLPSAGGIALLGGIQGLLVENIYINGSATLPQAITYEFGFATTTVPMQSSHMNEAKFTNIRIHNCDNIVGQGITLTGAYNVLIDGFYCTGIASPLSVNPGEASNFNPWAAKDTFGVKHNITVKNAVLQGFSEVGITVQGAQKITPNSGYLSYNNAPHPGSTVSSGQIVINDPNMYSVAVGGTNSSSGGGPTGTGTGIVDGTATYNWLASSYPFAGGTSNSAWPNETDLYDITLENIVIDGGSGGSTGTYGIWNNGAGRMHVTGAVITNCGRGIVATDEAVIQSYNGVVILNSYQMGMQLDNGNGIWSPIRGKKVEIRNCYIAGSSRSSAGSFLAIHLGACDSAIIENNRFGYEAGFAGFADASQAGALFLSSTSASNVICRGNRCATPVGAGNASYYSTIIGTQDCNGNSIINSSGDPSVRGNWLTEFQSASAQVLTSSSTIAISFAGGSPSYALRSVRVTNSSAIAGLILQAGYHPCQEVTVINEGTGSITFAPQSTSNVVDGNSDVIAVQQARRYVWDSAQSLWYPCR